MANLHSNARHLSSIHALRGVAAILVVGLHIHDHLPALNADGLSGIPGNLFLAVDLFFILSGAVLAHVYSKAFADGVETGNYLRFQGARFARIWPSIAAATLIALLARLLGDYAGTTDVAPASLTADVLAELFVASGWFTWAWLNSPTWSLSAEVAVYVVAPLLILAGARTKTVILVLLCVAAPIVPGTLFQFFTHAALTPSGLVAVPATDVVLFGPHAQWFWIIKGPFILMRAVPMFIVGVALYQIIVVRGFDRWCRPWALGLGLAVLLAAMHIDAPRVAILWLIVILVALSLGRATAEHGFFRSRILARLGDYSLAIYLVHMPLLRGGEAFLAMATGRLYEDLGLVEALALAGVLAVSALAASAFLFATVEVPARRWLRQRIEANLGRMREQPADHSKVIVGQARHLSWSSAVLRVAVMVGAICAPWGVVTQMEVVSRLQVAQQPRLALIGSEEIVPGEVRLLEFKIDQAEMPLPVTVRGFGGVHATLGPNSQKSLIVQEPGTFRVRINYSLMGEECGFDIYAGSTIVRKHVGDPENERKSNLSSMGTLIGN
ncbi:MAG: acyltransferase family protein [Geminicoccaceae bacterium]